MARRLPRSWTALGREGRALACAAVCWPCVWPGRRTGKGRAPSWPWTHPAALPPPLLKSATFVEGMANFVVAEPRLARRQRLAASVGIHGICALAALPYARRLGLLTETRVDAMHCLAGVGKTVKLALEEMCASRQ